MACGNSRKNPCRKSCVRYYNAAAQEFAAGSTTQITLAGAKVVNSGISIDADPQSYTTHTNGLYHISADVNVLATTAGTVTIEWQMDGTVLPCTMKAQTLALGSNAIHTETEIDVHGCCCDTEHVFTLVMVADATAIGTIVHVCSGIIKEA